MSVINSNKEKIIIQGNIPLIGDIRIAGSKNASLPILASSLLCNELKLHNVPRLQDVITMLRLLNTLGAYISLTDEGILIIDSSNLECYEAPYEQVSAMRASILVLCPLVARLGNAKVALPGGCAIGSRPVDYHIKGLQKMGAKIEIKNGFIYAKALDGLKGCNFYFEQPSVTGTENLVMASTLAKGKTVLTNCALEPEVIDLCDCLIKMGAKIKGHGTPTIVIEGVESLSSAEHSIIPDRIEAGTFMIAIATTKGKATIKSIKSSHLESLIASLRTSGVSVSTENVGLENEQIIIDAQDAQLKSCNISTAPFPGFPTDLQAQYSVLNTIADGKSFIQENIFENRFMHCRELQRMGAILNIKGNKCYFEGNSKLSPAPVKATDLRASASLITAALTMEGQSEIMNISHLDRGYELMEEKLSLLGAKIWRE